MATSDHQLHESSHAKLDNQGRNAVRPQTAEAYGDEVPMHAETFTSQVQHFPGQPLETVPDHEANESLREERYERAMVDPVFRAQQKIEISDEDKERDDYVADDALTLGTHIPLEAETVVPETDPNRTDVDQQLAAGSDSMHPVQPILASTALDDGDHAEPGSLAAGPDEGQDGTPELQGDPAEEPTASDAAREQNERDQSAVRGESPDHDNAE